MISDGRCVVKRIPGNPASSAFAVRLSRDGFDKFQHAIAQEIMVGIHGENSRYVAVSR